MEWKATRDRLLAAGKTQKDPATRSRVLLIVGAARNDGSCPGEISKTFRMTQWARQVLADQDIETDLLDLSLLISSYDLHIHPCKGCASTAMPLCHWPCSCYPNHGERQTNDLMAEIYEKWVAAHGGNPDPTTTHGKNAAEAKVLELAGWDYPKHLAGRVYGLVVHGDVAGIESLRRNLSDGLDWMGLIDVGKQSALDRAGASA